MVFQIMCVLYLWSQCVFVLFTSFLISDFLTIIPDSTFSNLSITCGLYNVLDTIDHESSSFLLTSITSFSLLLLCSILSPTSFFNNSVSLQNIHLFYHAYTTFDYFIHHIHFIWHHHQHLTVSTPTLQPLTPKTISLNSILCTSFILSFTSLRPLGHNCCDRIPRKMCKCDTISLFLLEKSID